MFSQSVQKWMGLLGIISLLTAPAVIAQDTINKEEREAFQRVTKRLDLNGNFLMYVNTQDAITVMDDMVQGINTNILPLVIKGKPDNTVMMIQAGEKLVNKLYSTSGLRDIDGFGASSVKIGNDLYRTKAFLGRKPESKGRIWKLMGGAPRKLDYVDFLPATTALASFGDFDLNELWTYHFELVQSTGNPMVVGLHQGAIEQLTQKNINLAELFSSTDGNYGMVITLDQKSMINFPMGRGKSIKLPEPGLALFVKVKDTKLRDFLFSKLVMNANGKNTPLPFQEKQASGITMRSYTLPLPLPFQVTPTVAIVDGYMILASTPKLMEQMITAKKQKNGLVKKDLFKTLMKGMPTEGNSFSYASPMFTTSMQTIQKQVGAAQQGQATVAIAKFSKLFEQDNAFALNITRLEADGIYMIGKNNMGISKGIATQIGAVVAIVAGTTLPDMVNQGGSANRIQDMNNLKQIGLGMFMYSGDHNGEFPMDLGKLVEGDYIQAGSVFVTPGTPDAEVPKTAADVRAGKCSYDYYGKGLKDDLDASGTTILASTKPGKISEWINILFVDGHVESVRATSVEDAARKSGWILKK